MILVKHQDVFLAALCEVNIKLSRWIGKFSCVYMFVLQTNLNYENNPGL